MITLLARKERNIINVPFFFVFFSRKMETENILSPFTFYILFSLNGGKGNKFCNKIVNKNLFVSL